MRVHRLTNLELKCLRAKTRRTRYMLFDVGEILALITIAKREVFENEQLIRNSQKLAMRDARDA